MPTFAVTWALDNLDRIGGNPVEVLGAPQLVDTPAGRAVRFNGESDGLLVHAHPLAGAARFTIEAMFRPDPGGLVEQRFLHIQPEDAGSRILLETRLAADGRWFLDTFIKSGESSQTLYADSWPHLLGKWYHAALVYDGEEMRHFVNRELEMAHATRYEPTRGGQTSLGVRMNRVSWYRGAIRQLRFTPSVLPPAQFLSVEGLAAGAVR
jgi:hypothetical protein